MSKIPGYRNKEGLYLHKFKEKEDAIDYINMLKRKYLYTPDTKNMSVNKLTKFARRDGAKISTSQLCDWFKELGVELRVTRPKTKKRYRQNFSLDEEVLEEVKKYPNQSFIAELGLRLVMGMEPNALIVFLPVDDGEDPINIIFYTDNDKIKALATGKLKQRDKSMISSLVEKAQQEGLDSIKQHLKLFEYKYYG